MSDNVFTILQSGTTTTIGPNDNILKSGELAYTYATGDSAGGDRLFIGAGGNDSANGYATEIHTIGGKYYTDMLDHPKGQVVPSSAIITDTNGKIDQLKVDNIIIDGSTISNTTEGITLDGNGAIDVSTQKISNVVDPSSAQDAATKNYVDTKDLVFVSGDVNQNGTGNVKTGKNIELKGGFNTNTKRIDQPDDAVRVEINLDSDVSGLSSLSVGYVDISGQNITTSNGDLTINSFDGTVTIGGNLRVLGTTTTVSSTELTIADKNIVLANGALNSTEADSGGIHLDGANADIYYKASNDAWHSNKKFIAPNIDVNGTISTSTFSGKYLGFDSDFAQKTTTDLTEGNNLYYTQGRFDSALSEKTTTDVTEGNNLYYTQNRFDSALSEKTTTDVAEGTNLYFTEERVDDRIYNLLRPGEGIDFLYNDATNEFDISAELASTLNPGIAKFDSQDFLVTAGNVEIATIDCGTY